MHRMREAQEAVLRGKARLREGVGGQRDAPSSSLDLIALPAPYAECLLVQPGLVHLVPAAQHHPGCQTCQVLPPHGCC